MRNKAFSKTPVNHRGNYFPQMEKSMQEWRTFKELLANRNYHKNTTSIHPGGHKRTQNNI